MKVGKHGRTAKSRIPMSQIYEQDKRYIGWVRDHIHEEAHATPCMLKLRLYTEMRDAQKKNRIMNQGTPHQNQGPLMPHRIDAGIPKSKAQAKAKMGVRGRRQVRKTREGSGWNLNSSSMDTDAWEAIRFEEEDESQRGVNEETQDQWIRIAENTVAMNQINQSKMLHMFRELRAHPRPENISMMRAVMK